MAVSVGKVSITPSNGTYMGGYGVDRPRASSGSYASLYARCIVLWDGGHPNVVVTADVLAFAGTMHQAIRNQVVKLGVGTSDFALTATHTHNGPVLIQKLDPYIAYAMTADQLSVVQSYSDWLVDKIVQLVRDTLNRTRTPCTLDYQVARQNFSINREGLPYTETDVPILVARSSSGNPLAVLFSYGCHPVAAGIQTLFDPDYPGAASSLIEDTTGAFAQFLPGPAGDQNPTGAFGWALRDRLGGELGSSVIEAIAAPGRDVGGPIRTAYQEIALPLDVTVTPGNIIALLDVYSSRRTNLALPGYYRRHAEVMIAQIQAGTFNTTISLPLQVWRFAADPDLRIALTGGEIVSGYGVYFRSLYGGSGNLIFGGYANEIPAYIPSDELLRKASSYAAGIDTDFPGIAGGSMTVYGCIGHFRGRPTTSSPDGVEQILISALRTMLGNP
jgi:neutral ceramidase